MKRARRRELFLKILMLSALSVAMLMLGNCVPKTPDVNTDALGIDRDSTYWDFQGTDPRLPEDDDVDNGDNYIGESSRDNSYRYRVELDWEELAATKLEYDDQGYQIIDVEIYHDSDFDKRYAAIWHRRKPKNRFLKLSSREVLKEKLTEYEAAGYIPIDIEIGSDEWDDVEILVIWEPGKKRYLVRENMSWQKFRQVYDESASRGFHLVDFEAAADEWGEVVTYGGIWHFGKQRQNFFKAKSRDDLLIKRKSYDAENLRILDLEMFVENGVKKYAALWGPGQDKQCLWFEAEFDNFEAKRQEFDRMSLRMIDIEIDDSDFNVKYTGVWRFGVVGSIVTEKPKPEKKKNSDGLKVLE